MSKDVNGYPHAKCASLSNQSTDANRSADPSLDASHECGGSGDCLDTVPLAYVYAPNQKFRLLYSAKESLKHGTLFEELYKPMGVYGHEH